MRISRDFGDVQPTVYLLSRLGTASGLTNNAAVALSGVWSRQPTVAVGLTDMRTYDPSYSASQEIEADITGLTYQSGGVYKAAAYASLVTSGGQYTWIADEYLPTSGSSYYYVDSAGVAYNRWDYTVTPPSVTYTFGWYGTVEDAEYVTATIYIHSIRNNPSASYYIYGSLAKIYIDYINQSTGSTANQLAGTYEFESGEAWVSGGYCVYLHNVQLGALASNVRIRVVMSNGTSHYYSSQIANTVSYEYVRFTGGILVKSSDAGRETIYSGTMSALAVGR